MSSVPRRPRSDRPCIPQHVIQRSAPNRQLFDGSHDAAVYLSVLSEACDRQGCDLHAYAFAPHEVRLLITGSLCGAVAGALHSSAQQYARYANTRDQLHGRLWHGRYQSCLVGGMKHVLDAHHLVEQAAQPVREQVESRRLVWSSDAANAHGAAAPWIRPHAAYMALGKSDAERRLRYRERLKRALNTDASLVLHTQQGCPWGSERFLQKLGQEMGELPIPRPRGRPRKVLGSPLRSLSLFLLTSWATVVETL